MARGELPVGSLLIETSKDGSEAPFWAGKWWWQGRQVKRRLGAAHVVPRDDEHLAPNDARGWERNWREPGGRPWPAGALTAKRARQALQDKIREYADEMAQEAEEARLRTRARREAVVKFGQVADEWMAERWHDVQDGSLKASTAKDYASMLKRQDDALKARGTGVNGKRVAHVMRAFDAVPVDAITGEDIDAFERKLRNAGLSPRTRSKYTVLLNLILDFAVSREYIEITPMATRAKRKRQREREHIPDVYALDTVERIAQATGGIMGEIVRTAALTGLRQGELLGLQWGDIDFAGRAIRVRRRYLPGEDEMDVPKGNRARVVPLIDQAAVVLDRVSRSAKSTRKNALVFARDNGDHVDPSALRKAYMKGRDAVIAAAAKEGDELPAIVFHGLRHTFGSTAAAQGIPLSTLKAWMGHADISTTLIYTHWMPQADDADRLTRAFAAAFGGPVEQVVGAPSL